MLYKTVLQGLSWLLLQWQAEILIKTHWGTQTVPCCMKLQEMASWSHWRKWRNPHPFSTRQTKSSSCQDLTNIQVSYGHAGAVYCSMTVAQGESTMIETARESLPTSEGNVSHGLAFWDHPWHCSYQGNLSKGQKCCLRTFVPVQPDSDSLIAEGETAVGKLVHLDRSYYRFHEKLA